MATRNSWFYTRHVIIPTLLVFGSPVFVFILALAPLPGSIVSNFKFSFLLGNQFSWTVVVSLITWSIISLKIPSKTFKGPVTSFGCTPIYSANGFQFFCSTVLLFIFVIVICPTFSETVVEQLPYILGTLNIVALIFCFYLWFNGRHHMEDPVLRTRLPWIFEFYRGMELHPRVFGMDAKQLINSRIGLIMWQLLTLDFLIASFLRNGFSSGILVNVLVQFAYLVKFYWWETGYFTSMDITLDRPGFYISWGHLNFVPSFYTFSTFYLLYNPSLTPDILNYIFLLFGLIFVYLNYAVDRQKELFNKTSGRCVIWGKKAKAIEGSHNNRHVRLLVSGYWGSARHLNYTFEQLLALFWNLPCYNLGLLPFMYNIFLAVLLIHRTYRDEEKCQSKYGPHWKLYCKQVPYRLIPKVF